MAKKKPNEQYNYVLDWIKQSATVRRAQNAFVERTVAAYQGKPSQNKYRKSFTTYADHIMTTDPARGELLKSQAKDIPDKGSLVLNDAVETVVSMCQGGVGRYEFGPYDPQMDKDDVVIDMLSSAAKHFYNKEKVDKVMPQFIRNAVLAGVSTLHLKESKGKKCLTLLESSEMLLDPKRSKLNYERFKGFTQRKSLKEIKDAIDKRAGGYYLTSINEAQVQLNGLITEMNSVLEKDATSMFLHDELGEFLNTFYRPIMTQISEKRQLQQKKAKNGNKNIGQDELYSYNGDEVEISYVYDYMNDLYFEVVNRQFIIVAKTNPLRRKVKAQYSDSKGKTHKIDKEIKLEDPFIELPYNEHFWDTYPTSPLFYILDDFDDLCAMESVLHHNLSIMAPINFIGQSSDAEKVAHASNIAGEIIEGMPQTFGTLKKDHDLGAVLASIDRAEQKIKRSIKAYDPFQLQAMLGDRASAKEVSALSSQVSQGLNPFIANIESAMATLGDKFIKLHLIMHAEDDFTFVHNGEYAELTAEDMAGDFEIQAKLASSIKLEQQSQSRSALELIQYLGGTDDIDKKEFLGTLIPITLSGVVSREQAKKMVAEQYRPMPEEVVAKIKANAEADAAKDPIDKLDFSGMGEEDIDNAIMQISQMMPGGVQTMPQGGPAMPNEEPIIMAGDPSASEMGAAQMPMIPSGAPQGSMSGLPSDPSAAGEVANDPGRIDAA